MFRFLKEGGRTEKKTQLFSSLSSLSVFSKKKKKKKRPLPPTWQRWSPSTGKSTTSLSGKSRKSFPLFSNFFFSLVKKSDDRNTFPFLDFLR